MPKLLITLMICTLAAMPAGAAEFKWLDSHGQTHSLSEYHGRPVALHLWASWCVPCRNELPELTTWLKQHPHTPMVLVSLDNHQQDAATFLKQHHIRIPLLLSDEAQAFNLGARGLPTTAVIGADGDIRRIWVGAQSWEHGFGDKLLAELSH